MAVPHEYYDSMESPLGRIYLLFNKSCLSGISFDQPSLIPFRSGETTAAVKKELAEYFGNKRRCFSIRTAFLEGTEFEKKVWNALREIPYGETRTYKWLAEKIGLPKAARAVGNALGKNPVPIIFPCHRIIESDGKLGGYTPGTDIKRRLLGIEYYCETGKE
ncbi:MAG: methylated-DNA--[protein]-cysteine S-methyltransferase [Nitrospirae bacterium]|nr:methylated-DNA--[protein]-cysteine S-methyltransferase [Nitrospirota bacterium]